MLIVIVRCSLLNEAVFQSSVFIRSFADLKTRLTDIVALQDSCRKLIELYDDIISLKVDQRRKDWFQMPGYDWS